MKKRMIISKEMVTFAELIKQSMMKRTILTLVALLSMVAQFSYGQKELSIKEMEDSMALGNLNIQVDLATEYITGERVKQDLSKAYSLIRDAAEKGNRYGQLMLGVCYEDGISVERNLGESFNWFKRSADQGNVLAQFKVSLFYEQGIVVERDLNKAFEWTAKSAQRYPLAKISLAKYYFNGWGTEPDRTKAKLLLDSLKVDEELDEQVSQYCNIIERGDTMTAYGFQFSWIPSMLFEWQKGNVDDAQLTDITAWQLNLGSMFISHYEWDWSAISAQVYSQPNNIDIIVYKMPEPEKMPLCRYVAAALDRNQHTVRYFTLELTNGVEENVSDKKRWMFCGVSSNLSHLNFGPFNGNATEQGFLEYVKKKLSKTENAKTDPEVIQTINDSICAEGAVLYTAERLNWVSTDSVLARYRHEDLGGSLIWQPTASTWSAIFYDKDKKNCIFELKLNTMSGANSLSYDIRPLTEEERVQIKLKHTMLDNAFEKYGDQIKYNEKIGNPNFDFVRINDNLIRLYVLQGTVQPNTIPFGNDCSIDFDNSGNPLCFRKYHQSLIAIKTDEIDKAISVVHSHLADNPYITPTDVCNFLLYRGELDDSYILSTALGGYIIHHAANNTTEFKPAEMIGKP
jgi:hypothetical protein